MSIYRSSYSGGATAFVGILDPNIHNLQLVFDGFTTAQALVEVQSTGANSSDWKTLTVPTTETSIVVTNVTLVKLRISGLSAGTYYISAYQF